MGQPMEPRIIKYPFGDRTFTSSLYYGQSNLDSLRSLPDGSVQCVVTSPPYWGLRSYLTDDDPLKDQELGREATPEEFVDSMVRVFREVHRVLRDDGTVWLNLGDSYAANRAPHSFDGYKKYERMPMGRGRSVVPPGLKPKDLAGIPWEVALGLRRDGWYLRSDIVWEKPNPLPEPVLDRPTRSHEFIFLLSKQEHYYYDNFAIREPGTNRDPGSKSHRQATAGLSRTKMGLVNIGPAETRNARSVWTITPSPYKGAHFATMPPRLVEPCIRAGTSEKGCCSHCGSPWERRTENQDLPGENSEGRHRKVTVGWDPTCDCPPNEPVPCVVMDPFSGSATVGFVANREGRDYVGLDLNQEYVALAEARILGYDPPPTDIDPLEDAGSVMDLF